jgi:transposase-like protein
MVTQCPGCGSADRTKDGIIKGRQRWKCKGCNKRSTVVRPSDVRPPETRRLALELYLEGLGFRAIGRVLKVSYVTVFGWIKEYGRKAAELKSEQALEVVALDELHTYIGNKKATAGYGLLLIDMASGSSLLSVGAAERQPARNS